MQTGLLPIQTVAQKLQIPDRYFEPIGLHGGKVRLDLLGHPSLPRRGKLILVTATTPAAFGEGKTVTAIGLAQGLARIGKESVVTLRQPSLGPVFGMKGDATGGGLSQIEPSEKINHAAVITNTVRCPGSMTVPQLMPAPLCAIQRNGV